MSVCQLTHEAVYSVSNRLTLVRTVMSILVHVANEA